LKLLLDTCVVLWAGVAPEQLSRAARAAITDPGAEIHVATITAAEIACAVARGRVALGGHWKPWLRRALAINGWTTVPATPEIVEEAYSLPDSFHADLADRIIVATARLQGMRLVTGDEAILGYPHVDIIW